jgi:uncharacterized protein YlaI
MKCQICEAEDYFQKHRIISGAYGGKYTKDNTAYLCSNCHTKVHISQIILEGMFLTSSGYKLIWHRQEEPSITGMEQTDKVYTYKPQRSS